MTGVQTCALPICFDPDEPFVVDPAILHSRSKNTPFDEARMQGVVKMTIVGGEALDLTN